jgi:hypothetical protein
MRLLISRKQHGRGVKCQPTVSVLSSRSNLVFNFIFCRNGGSRVPGSSWSSKQPTAQKISFLRTVDITDHV